MKKILLLLANGFEIYEASVFIDVMGWDKTYGSKNIELQTCAITKQVTSTFGVKLEVDLLLNEINVADFDALAIPGGFEDFNFYQDAYSIDFQNIIKAFYNQNKLISTICVAALALGKSGVLQNKCATTYNLMGGKRQKQLKEFGVDVINKPIVQSETITTSWSPVTAIDVAFKLLQDLSNKENMLYIKSIMGFE